MTEPTKVEQLETRIAALEIRLNEAVNLLNLAIGSAAGQPSQAGSEPEKKSTKMTKAEKEAAVAKMMEGVPYSAAALKDMPLKEKRWLAKGLGISSFGMKGDELHKAVAAAQKKVKPAAPKK